MAAFSRRALLLAQLPAVVFASFVPLPFHHFQSTAQKGVRRVSHSEHHLINGDTALHLSWSADVDPDTILALDTEHEKGVHLVSCRPDELVLHLPASHLGAVSAWKHITASIEKHNCAHLEDHPLYHRIERMSYLNHPDTPLGGKTVKFGTTELYSISQVMNNVDFTYAVTPLDSLHPDEQAEAREYMAQMRQLQGAQQTKAEETLAARRLQQPDSAAIPTGLLTGTTDRSVVGKPSPLHFKWNSGALDGFKSGFHQSIGQVTVTNSFTTDKDNADQMKQWKPMTHANFGWNWNYHTNTTRNPQFKFTLPGMEGYVLLKNPYLKFLGLFHIKFNSHWNDENPFATPPHVKLESKLEGNAYVNADLSMMSNIYRDVVEDPFGRFHVPLLNNFTKETHYFKHVNFFIGNVPVTLQPGVSVNLNAYHLGLFKGAVRLGVNVHLRIKADATYDSTLDDALKFQFKAEALNVKMLPPTWLIHTKHLEFGALLTPTFWLKGGMGPVRDVTLELQLKPYMNVSVAQEGQDSYGVQQQVLEKHLVVMPFRAINLEVDSEWSIGIEANGRRIMTSTELSLGVVEFADYVEHFRFGLIDQRRLLRDPIRVVLFKNGVEQVGRVVSIYCESVVGGDCQPAPFNAEFQIDGKTVVVQLTLAWHYDPVPYMLSKVRAMSFVFPQLALSRAASEDYFKNPPEQVYIKISRNGREYKAYQKPRIIHKHLVVIEPKKVQDLGSSWMDGWRESYNSVTGKQEASLLIDPKVELYYVQNGVETRMAHTFLPAIDWDRALSSEDDNRGAAFNRFGVGDGGKSGVGNGGGLERKRSAIRKNFIAGTKGFHHLNPREVYRGGFFFGNIPIKIALAGGQGAIFSTGHMGIDVHSPGAANRWLRPFRTESFLKDSQHSLLWTTRHGRPDVTSKFHLVAYKVGAHGEWEETGMSWVVDQACKINDPLAAKYLEYGSECVFSQQIRVDPSLVGVNVIFQLTFRDHADKFLHKMVSAPVKFVDSLDTYKAQRDHEHNWANVLHGSESNPFTGSGFKKAIHGFKNAWDHLTGDDPASLSDDDLRRRLTMENGVMVDAPVNSNHEVDVKMAELPVQKEGEDKEATEFEKPRASRRLGMSARRLAGLGVQSSNINFGARMSALHPICTKKPLHYSIGAGIYFRAQVHNLHFRTNAQEAAALGPLSSVAGLLNVAHLDTHDIALANTDVGKKLSDIFPKGLCTEGVCEGTLPGCPGQMAQTMMIPKVEFRFKRKFQWTADATQDAKTATAYAMAVVPEFIRVASIIITSMVHASTTRAFGLSESNQNRFYGHNNAIYVHGHPCSWTPNPECVHAFRYRGVDYQGCTIEDHLDRGWCSTSREFHGSWRNCLLTCRDDQGLPYVVPDVAEAEKKAFGAQKGVDTLKTATPAPPPPAPPVIANVAGNDKYEVGSLVKGVSGAIKGLVGTVISQDGTMVQVHSHQLGMKTVSVNEIEHHVQRRLAEAAEPADETDRVSIEIDPKALSYVIDEDLIHELIRRKAFRGMGVDGKEAQLGENEITHFKLHRGDSEPGQSEGDMIAVAPEEKFEWDSHINYGTDAKSSAMARSAVVGVAVFAVLFFAGLVAVVYRSSRTKQVVPYLLTDVAEEPVE